MSDTNKLCPGCMNDAEGKRVCPICGYDSTVDNPSEYLPIRFNLAARYTVGRMVALDCEGVTYIGFDGANQTTVHIKEYFPSGISVRNPDKTVSMLGNEGFAYNDGLMRFVEIGKTLMVSEAPALVATLACFEENGTAYKIFEKPSGITLDDFLSRNGGTLRFPQARPLFLPLIDTVISLNEQGIIHGGISPETIMVGRDGKLRLKDAFVPAARTSGGTITPELYAGFAAAEQYGLAGGELTGASDVYGLCTTLFKVLVGNELPAACERVGNAGMSIPARLADELPRQVLVALANGLQVMPEDRTPTVEKLRNELVYGETEENARRAESRRNAELNSADKADKKKGGGAKYAAVAAVCTIGVFLLAGIVLCFTVFKDQIFKANEDMMSSEESIVAPSVPSIGDFDPEAVESKRLYAVPDFSGQYYAQIIDNDEYENFKIKINSVKEYSDKYAKGMVCKQSVAEGAQVEKETEIVLTISLGSPEVKVPNVLDLDESSAKIELLKQGFLYENIEVVEKYDVESKPGIVLQQDPKAGTTASTEILVRIYINSYDGVEEDGATGFVVDDDIPYSSEN